MNSFFHGFALAFSLILPLGIQNVFIFNQGATSSPFYRALPAILTAAICDTVMILLAVGGISMLILELPMLQTTLITIGSIFMMYMGWSIWNNNDFGDNGGSNVKNLSVRKQILFAASVSILNPYAMMDIIGVIGTNSIRYSGMDKFLYSSSVILVSWVWFFGLAIAGSLSGRFNQNERIIPIFNKVSAIIIWIISFKMIWDTFGY